MHINWKNVVAVVITHGIKVHFASGIKYATQNEVDEGIVGGIFCAFQVDRGWAYLNPNHITVVDQDHGKVIVETTISGLKFEVESTLEKVVEKLKI